MKILIAADQPPAALFLRRTLEKMGHEGREDFRRNADAILSRGKQLADEARELKKLKALNYRGPVTIEREISGPKQMEDIKKEKLYLEKLIA